MKLIKYVGISEWLSISPTKEQVRFLITFRIFDDTLVSARAESRQKFFEVCILEHDKHNWLWIKCQGAVPSASGGIMENNMEFPRI